MQKKGSKVELQSEPATRRVLVIEAHPDLRFLLKENLRYRLNCEVTTTDSIADAKTLIRNGDFEFVISDYPSEKLGIELINELIKSHKDIPLLFFSNGELKHYIFRHLDYPFSSIDKPKFKELLELVSETMDWPLKQSGETRD